MKINISIVYINAIYFKVIDHNKIVSKHHIYVW